MPQSAIPSQVESISLSDYNTCSLKELERKIVLGDSIRRKSLRIRFLSETQTWWRDAKRFALGDGVTGNTSGSGPEDSRFDP